MSGAKPANRKQHFDFYTVAENLAIAAGLPKPKLYVIDDTAMNAFATGRDPSHAVVCATTGILAKLERRELEGVIAHELSHIKNFDTRLMAVVAVLVGTVAFWRICFSGIFGGAEGGIEMKTGGRTDHAGCGYSTCHHYTDCCNTYPTGRFPQARISGGCVGRLTSPATPKAWQVHLKSLPMTEKSLKPRPTPRHISTSLTPSRVNNMPPGFPASSTPTRR